MLPLASMIIGFTRTFGLLLNTITRTICASAAAADARQSMTPPLP